MDTLIKNVTVIDGSGRPGYIGNVGIRGGKILMDPADGGTAAVIDGTGKYLCPGFIDAHSHGDQILGQEQAKLSKVSQGITTEIAGQCGGSMFPVSKKTIEMAKGLLSIGTLSFPEEMETWTDGKSYFDWAEKVPLAANMKVFIGHTTLRIAVMGYDSRRPTAEEMEKMKALVRDAMEHGAMGLSSGLIYAPGCYGDIEELSELCKVVAEYDGYYVTHMRNESYALVEAVQEALEIGRRSGVRVWISHHKACGRKNWGKVRETLRLIDQANAEGMTVTVDHYPYTANLTNLNIPIPPEYFREGGVEGLVKMLEDPAKRAEIRAAMEKEDCGYDNFYQNAGGFDGIFVSGCPGLPEADGKFVSEYAKETGRDPFDAYFDILQANGGRANGIYYTVSEEDLCDIIRNPNACVGTDGNCRSMEEKTHPRTFGTFPKAIRRYHRELGILSLEEIIRKITSFPAERAGLKNKGLIADGYDADLVLFDYEKLTDRADYLHSTLTADGIETVFVNGVAVYRDGKLTGANPGKIIPHYRKEGRN